MTQRKALTYAKSEKAKAEERIAEIRRKLLKAKDSEKEQK